MPYDKNKAAKKPKNYDEVNKQLCERKEKMLLYDQEKFCELLFKQPHENDHRKGGEFEVCLETPKNENTSLVDTTSNR